MSRSAQVTRTAMSGALLAALSACGAAPQSAPPTARALLERLAEQQSCSRGVQGEATLDYFGDEGRVTGSVLYYAMLPETLRFDVVSPFGVALSTLTADGEEFALYDLKNGQFLYGPASDCNVARFTQVPVPPFALVQLLGGTPPVLKHEPARARLQWESGFFSGGYYAVHLSGAHQSTEEIRVFLNPDDYAKPWREQRLRLLQVTVLQAGVELYDATLKEHRVALTKGPFVDPDGLAPPLPPSGPECKAELPGSLRIEVETQGRDLVFRNEKQWHNPPLSPGLFRQTCPAGVACRRSECQGR